MKVKDILKQIDLELKQVKNRVADRKKFLKHFANELAQLQELGIEGSFCGEFFDFDHLSQELKTKVLLVLPGMWNKTYYEDQVNYTLKTAFNHGFRLYNAELPPSCKMIPYEVVEPAVPSRVVTKYRIQCSEQPQLTEQI